MHKQPPAPEVCPAGLHAIDLFDGVEAPLVRILCAAGGIDLYPAGRLILSPEQANEHLYLVLKGRLRIETLRDGLPVLAHIGPGQCVGELSAVQNLPPSARVSTDVDTWLFAIHASVLDSILNRSAVLSRNLLRVVGERLRRDNLRLERSFRRQARLQRSASVDPLTGLRNRRGLDAELERRMRNADGGGTAPWVMMIDLDHFKRYNDTHGHPAGDRALAAAGAALHAATPPDAHCSRYGGEELLCAFAATRGEAEGLAEGICGAIRGARILDDSGSPLPGITASVGGVQYRPQQHATAADLLADADAALYQAKRTGRDRWCLL